MPEDVCTHRGEVVKGRLRLHELHVHQAGGGVIDHDQQGASWGPPLEPVVWGAVDLNQFPAARAPLPHLVDDYFVRPARLPSPLRDQ